MNDTSGRKNADPGPHGCVHVLFEEHGHESLRLVDNGITERRSPTLEPDVLHTYHLIPRAAGKGRAVETHIRRRGLCKLHGPRMDSSRTGGPQIALADGRRLMSLTTILVIVAVVILLGGGLTYWRR